VSDEDFAKLVRVVEVIHMTYEHNYSSFRCSREIDEARALLHELRESLTLAEREKRGRPT